MEKQCDRSLDHGEEVNHQRRGQQSSAEQSLHQSLAAEQQRLQSDISFQELRALTGIDELVKYRQQLDAARLAANQLSAQLKLNETDRSGNDTVPSPTVVQFEKNGVTHLHSDVGAKHKKVAVSSSNHSVSPHGENKVSAPSKKGVVNPTGDKVKATLTSNPAAFGNTEKVKSPKRQHKQTMSPPLHVASPKKQWIEAKKRERENTVTPVEPENKSQEENTQPPVKPQKKTKDEHSETPVEPVKKDKKMMNKYQHFILMTMGSLYWKRRKYHGTKFLRNRKIGS